MSEHISETEQLVLLAIARLGEGAYGVTVRQEIEATSGRPVSIAAVYGALERLERRGLAVSWLGDPTPERGGRARKQFRVTKDGARAVEAAREMMNRMWAGVDLDRARSS